MNAAQRKEFEANGVSTTLLVSAEHFCRLEFPGPPAATALTAAAPLCMPSAGCCPPRLTLLPSPVSRHP
jgi:hypothetical protein